MLGMPVELMEPITRISITDRDGASLRDSDNGGPKQRRVRIAGRTRTGQQAHKQGDSRRKGCGWRDV